MNPIGFITASVTFACVTAVFGGTAVLTCPGLVKETMFR